MTFKPSAQQQAIFDFITREEGSALIEAVAGAGKTKTLIESIKYLPGGSSILFLAFNKSIATELAERLPDHVTVKTLNALGHQIWRRFTGATVQINANKTYDILSSEEHFLRCSGENEGRITERRWMKLRAGVRRLVALAKQAGICPEFSDSLDEEQPQGLMEDTLENWVELIRHYDLDLSPAEDDEEEGESLEGPSGNLIEDSIAMARACLEIGNRMWAEIDFDDQLYLPAIYRAKPKEKFDVVFVDEAQDVSPIQIVLLRAVLRKRGGRLFAVGDSRQAIYGWRGSDSQSLRKIKEEFGCVSLPLSTTYRCPRKVVELAQKYTPEIMAADTAPEGVVTDLGPYKPDSLSSVFSPGDLVVCRNTAPLIRLALGLIRKRVPARVIGNDIGAGLQSLVRSLRAKSLDNLLEKLSAWRDKEIRKRLQEDPGANLSYIEDRYGCLVEIIYDCPAGSGIEAVKRSITTLFSNPNEEEIVRLSTIHRAKGLEARKVHILDSHLMPSRYAKQEWQLEQERNLAYVAITRAVETLTFVNSPNKK